MIMTELAQGAFAFTTMLLCAVSALLAAAIGRASLLEKQLEAEQKFVDELERKLEATLQELDALEARVKQQSPLKLVAKLRQQVVQISASNTYELHMSNDTRQDFLRALEPDVYLACISNEPEMVFGMPIKVIDIPYRVLLVVCPETGSCHDALWKVHG